MAFNSYGPAVDNSMAKEIASGAIGHARLHGWNIAVAVVDTHGMLIYYEMMDDTQTGSADICIAKARTAATFRRPTSAFEGGLNSGTRPSLSTFGVNMIEGGIPIVREGGKVAGAIGVSGVQSSQDAACAEAGLACLDIKRSLPVKSSI
mmetsp:Transcript_20003/g.45421  ORF Transcript_20003/g.45421 Transcript_20003/m.45421 type:complete len:149 (-) Transcript_20003:99-545(-)